MKTTKVVHVESELHRQLRRHAADRDVTIIEVVDEGLREYLTNRAEMPKPPADKSFEEEIDDQTV
jgi:hypothetical protein